MNSQRKPSSNRKAWRAFRKGQSAAELAFVAPALVLLLVVAADFARLFFVSISVVNAARAGAQYGSQSVITAANVAADTHARRARAQFLAPRGGV